MVFNTVKGCRGGNTLGLIYEVKVIFFSGGVKLDSCPCSSGVDKEYLKLSCLHEEMLLSQEYRHCRAQDQPGNRGIAQVASLQEKLNTSDSLFNQAT